MVVPPMIIHCNRMFHSKPTTLEYPHRTSAHGSRGVNKLAPDLLSGPYCGGLGNPAPPRMIETLGKSWDNLSWLVV